VVAVATSACAAIEGLNAYGPGSSDGGIFKDGSDSPTMPGDELGADAMPEATPEEAPPEDSPEDASAPEVVTPSDAPLSTDDAPAFDAGNCTSAVDPAHGVFVARTGTDGAGCGTTTATPCQSIGAGIATALANVDGAMRNIVYVAAGRYTEKVTLSGGVTVQGGWHWDGTSTWTFECVQPAESVVVVQAPPADNMTVVATADDGKTTTLSTLTVLSKPSANPGESLYGIFATGANTVIALTDVVVTMQAGGNGAAGTMGDAGAPAAGSCSSGDGASATTIGSTGTAGAAGTFSSTGYTTHSGGTGGNGSAGDNGAAGTTPGATVPYTNCGASQCTQTAQMSCVGGPGVPGCSGGGGIGGTGGAGGGSSVAVFAKDSTVTITAGGYLAGNGGNGGAGGAGGPGAPGTSGGPGPSSLCITNAWGPCDGGASNTCMPTGTVTAAGSTIPGTAGGSGSNGGQGGGGAGGNSYAVLMGGLAAGKLNIAGSPALSVGKAGAGGAGGGPPGNAAATGPSF